MVAHYATEMVGTIDYYQPARADALTLRASGHEREAARMRERGTIAED